jgi:delta-aminolevulinic acid dehydratase/porphobilinogen synthase
MFVIDGSGRREPVSSMPGIDRLSIDCWCRRQLERA